MVRFFEMDTTDICELEDERAIISCLKERFENQSIYTYLAKVLISINPYRDINGLYSKETQRLYHTDCSDQLAPHLYAMANRIIQRKERLQSIVLTGQSGSGKTKSASHILSFLSESSLSEQIKERIFSANFIFELFGNASTGLNRNSSRFTKLTEMHFHPDLQAGLASVQFSYLLLENSRVYSRNKNESNFHILHLIKSAAHLHKELHLNITENYAYLPNFHVSKDSTEFEAADRSLAIVGISSEGRMQIYRILAAILHLGNVVFEEKFSGKCTISELSRVHIEHSARLLEINVKILESALLTRTIVVSGSDLIMDLSLSQAIKAKNFLSKCLYESLFQDVVFVINANLSNQQQTQMKVNMVDIAGFESFEKNYFEQICINYINEKIQQMFVKIMLKAEQNWYAEERLEIPIIPFLDNIQILDVFEHKSIGIFKLLDDVCKIQCQNSTNLVENIFSFWPNHPFIISPKPAEIQQNTGFIIRHFAADVLYDAVNFVEKNPNIVPKAIDDICRAIQMSRINNANSNLDSNANVLRSKSTTYTLKMGTSDLITKLNETECSFLRCIKPNQCQCSNVFDKDLVLTQLLCTGCIAYQQLMRLGYPYHINLNDFFNKIEQNVEFSKYVSKNQKEFYSLLLRSCGLKWIDFRLGNKKLFLRNGKIDILTEKLKADFEIIINRCKILKLLRSKWRIAIIIVRLCSIRKKRPIQDIAIITPSDLASDATASENFGSGLDICPNMSEKLAKKRKLNIKNGYRVESMQVKTSSTQANTEVTHPFRTNCRTTIAIPSASSSNQGKYPETITTEECLRNLLHREQEQHSQLKLDYNKLQKRNLDLMANLSDLKSENERLVNENQKLNNVIETSQRNVLDNVLNDHNYY